MNRLFGVALAGFPETASGNALWRDSVNQMLPAISQPYLAAMFALLSFQPLSAILNNEGLLLRDRIGFACRFCDDRDVRTPADRCARPRTAHPFGPFGPPRNSSRSLCELPPTRPSARAISRAFSSPV